jgi:hypothetical protein
MRGRWGGKWAEGRIAAKLYVLVRDYHSFVKRGCYKIIAAASPDVR